MNRLLGCCVLAAAGVTSAHASGPNDESCACAIWVPGTGNWSNPARWTAATVPGVGPDLLDIFIDQQAAQWQRAVDVWPDHTGNSELYDGTRHSVSRASIVFVDIDVVTASVFLGSSDELHVLAGRSLHLGNQSDVETEGPTVELVNHGRVVVGGSGDQAMMVVDADQTLRLSGSGQIELNDEDFAYLIGSTGNEMLVNESNTIIGAGQIGGGLLGVDSSGMIESSVPFSAITIEPSATGLRNRGVVRAGPWARVNIRDATVMNDGGLLAADDAATIDLSNTTVVGGTISTSADGVARNVDGPATLRQVTLEGNYEVGLTTLTLRDALTNDGTVYSVGQETASRGAAEASRIQIESTGDAFELAGSGQVVLNSAFILSDQTEAPTFINGSDHTISGRGAVGGNSLKVINNGVIDADAGLPLLLDPDDSQPLVNNGTLRATGAGGMFLLDGVFTNNGTIEVNDGSQVVLLPGASLSNAIAGSLSGGTWIVHGRTQPASMTLTAITDITVNLADVTLDGPLASFPRMDPLNINGGALTISGGKVFTTAGAFTNIKTLTVGTGSRFESSGKLTLTDTSTLVLQVGVTQSAKVSATNRIALGGVLEIQCPYGSWPVNQQIELLNASQITGSFDEIIAPGPFEIDVSGGKLIITPLPQPPCPADFDGDNQVGPMDLFALLASWGACPGAGDCPWDVTDDGMIDSADLFELLDQWGACP